MLQLVVNGQARPLPTSWDEAGRVAWAMLRDLVRRPGAAGRARALRRLTGLSFRQWQQLSELQLQTLDQGTPWLQLDAQAQPLRRQIGPPGLRLRMPKPYLEDGTALAYVLADEYFDAWAGGDEQAAYSLLAVLLRPYRLGRRLDVSSREQVARMARLMRYLGPEWRAQAIMFWLATRRYIHDTYGPWLFQPQPEADEEEGPATSRATGLDLGWWSVLMDIAESGTFGSMEQVQRTEFHTLCVYLIKKSEEAAAREREMARIHARTTS